MIPKLTIEQRKLASIDLTATYLSNYYAGWRYAKVLTLEKLINERYVFFKEIALQTKPVGDDSGEATIAQEIQHGLYFDAISQCVQYVEDLFALIKASKQPDFFVRNVITYKAGEVINYLKSFKADEKNIGSIFHFPADLPFSDTESAERYNLGKSNLINYTNDLIKFYKDYEFFYNQYKHGLAVAMRPFGNIYNQDQIENDKTGKKHPYLSVYDNMNLQAGFKRGTASIKNGILMLGFTDNVRPYISQLSEENNFIRLVHPPDYPNLSIELLVDIAKKTFCCVNIFIDNYHLKIKPEEGNRKFELPRDYQNNSYMLCSYIETKD